MHWVDWFVVGSYLAVVTLIGLLFVKRASSSVADYFVAGRKLPWWLAGTSLVATSFAADTPLFVAGLIATHGIAGNWVWWNQVVAWSLAIAVFARLWRRSGVVTDAEFIELRYSGASAAFLRGFRGFYMSSIISTATLAWVMLAMQKIVSATIAKPSWVGDAEVVIASNLGLALDSVDLWKTIVLCSLFVLAALYTMLSGMWGIVVTDLVQFGVALFGSVLFAVYALDSAGGMAELKLSLVEEFGADRASGALSFFPATDAEWMPMSVLVIYLSVLWWGDCNGFAAQRLFSTRSERDSVLSAIWYSVAHFAIRPWPWVVVGLVAMLRYPQLDDPESGYPMLMMEILPIGLRGLLVASLLAAFMSTVDTHLNWNASYFVNDIYRRFISPDASEKNCVLVSRMAVGGFAALAIVVAYFMTSIESGVLILFNLQAGVGLVLMLRWFWWRINAYSEIAAMIGSVVVTTALPVVSDYYGWDWSPAVRILLTVLLVTPFWLAVTFLTRPTTSDRLDDFYQRIRPPALFWGPVANRHAVAPDELKMGIAIAGWILCSVAIFSVMFAIGDLVLLRIERAPVWLAAASFAVWLLWRYKLIRVA